MTKIPFPTVCVAPHHLPCSPGRILTPITRDPPSPAAGSRAMSAATKPMRPECGGDQTLDLRAFPAPVSPPYPPLSKEVELRRAMSAASRSALFSLADGHIVFEDPWLVVVNKPPGVYCEALLSAYSSLALPSSSPPPPPPAGGDKSAGGGGVAVELHLANRLDRDTSGLMVITKSHKAAAKLVKAFTEHRVAKTYVTLCTGRAPEWGRIRVVSGHGRSRFGAWRVYAASDVGRALPGGSAVRHMATSFELLAVNGQGVCVEPVDRGVEGETLVVEGKAAEEEEEEGMGAGGGGKADEILVRARPESGRTHQIRLHCQYLGVPIKGDVKYGGVCEWLGEACECHALHAESLQLEHPVTGLPLRFHAPLPPWASSVLGAGRRRI